jgi:hypothetical protein
MGPAGATHLGDCYQNASEDPQLVASNISEADCYAMVPSDAYWAPSETSGHSTTTTTTLPPTTTTTTTVPPTTTTEAPTTTTTEPAPPEEEDPEAALMALAVEQRDITKFGLGFLVFAAFSALFLFAGRGRA